MNTFLLYKNTLQMKQFINPLSTIICSWITTYYFSKICRRNPKRTLQSFSKILKKWFINPTCKVMHVISSNIQPLFTVVNDVYAMNDRKILNECFLSTTCIVIALSWLNIQLPNNVLHISKELTFCCVLVVSIEFMNIYHYERCYNNY